MPFYDPYFGDAAWQLDAVAALGYLAASTSEIALGTAGFVATLRHPALLAKAIASIDRLSTGRFIAGLSTGDRASEYPAMGVDFTNRGERFREGFGLIRALLSEEFAQFEGEYYGRLDGSLNLVPRPAGAVPMIAIGRSLQSIKWLANTPDAWIWRS